MNALEWNRDLTQTVAAIREKMVRTYERTPVDGLLWCIGDHEVYNFETQVGEQIGSGSQDLRHESAINFR